MERRLAFESLSAAGFQRRDPEFRHQHAVDAHAAQAAAEGDPAVALVFALVGLCLHLEHGWSGAQVQRAHVRLARRRPEWPRLELPPEPRGALDARDVLAAEPGAARDALLRRWCETVWTAHAANQAAIRAWLAEYGVLGG